MLLWSRNMCEVLCTMIITTKTYLETRTWAFNTHSSDLVDPSLTDNESVSCAFYVDIHTSHVVRRDSQTIVEWMHFFFLINGMWVPGLGETDVESDHRECISSPFPFPIDTLIDKETAVSNTSHICIDMEKYSELKWNPYDKRHGYLTQRTFVPVALM